VTPEQLDEIERLAEAATQGPWSIDMDADVVADSVLEPAIPDDVEAGGLWPKRVAGFPYTHEGSHQRKDAAFIVAMREYALPLVKALREALAALEWQAAITKALLESQERLAQEVKEVRAEVERLKGLMECPYTDNGTHWCAGCASYTDGSAGEFLSPTKNLRPMG